MSRRPVRASHVPAYSTTPASEVIAVLGVLTLTAGWLSLMLMRAVGAW